MNTSRGHFASTLCKIAAVVVGLIGLVQAGVSGYIYYITQSEMAAGAGTSPNYWINIFVTLTSPALTGLVTAIFFAVMLFAAGVALERFWSLGLDAEDDEDEEIEISEVPETDEEKTVVK